MPETRVLGLHTGLAGIQNGKAVLRCSRTFFSHCGSHFSFPVFLIDFAAPVLGYKLNDLATNFASKFASIASKICAAYQGPKLKPHQAPKPHQHGHANSSRATLPHTRQTTDTTVTKKLNTKNTQTNDKRTHARLLQALVDEILLPTAHTLALGQLGKKE